MKTKLTTAIFLMGMALNAFAQTSPLPNVQAPSELVTGEYQEGTLTQLSKTEIEQFLPWAQNAQSVLNKALKNSKTMPVRERLPYIESTVKSVVRNSGTKNYQMFMRFALNRGLLLAGELKKEANVEDIGIRENILDILVKSIHVSLAFYESDLEFQKRAQAGNTAITQEYATFGVTFTKIIMPSVQNILDASAEYKLLYKTFEMLNWDLSKDSEALDYSDTITEIYERLQSISETPSQDDEENLMQIRRLMTLKEGVEKLKIKIQVTITKKSPCGLEGSIDERIRDCSYQLTSKKENWVLVTRTKDLKEIYKDTKSGLIWGDRLPSEMTHEDAQNACIVNLAEVGKISEVTWRLPSKKEYEEAEKNGIREALPNMNDNFWSSLVTRIYSKVDGEWLFSVFDGLTRYVNRNETWWVRCVAR